MKGWFRCVLMERLKWPIDVTNLDELLRLFVLKDTFAPRNNWKPS